MTIESIDDDIIYGDVLSFDQRQALDFLGIEWRGRNVQEIYHEIRDWTINRVTKSYEEAHLNNSPNLSHFKSLRDYVFEKLPENLQDIEEVDTDDDKFSKYDPISGTQRLLIAAEKKKKKKKWWKIALIVVAVVGTAVVVTALTGNPGAGATAGGATAGALNNSGSNSDRRKNSDDKKTSGSPPSDPPTSPSSTNNIVSSVPTHPLGSTTPVNSFTQSPNLTTPDMNTGRPSTFNPTPTVWTSPSTNIPDMSSYLQLQEYQSLTRSPQIHPLQTEHRVSEHPRISQENPVLNKRPSNPPMTNVPSHPILGSLEQPTPIPSPNWRPHLPPVEDTRKLEMSHPTPSTGPVSNPNMNPLKQPSSPNAILMIDPDAPPRIHVHSPEVLLANTPIPRVFEVPGKKLARGQIGGINGMGNNLEMAQENARYIGQLSSNHHIDWTFNHTNSILFDVAEATVLNFKGISGPAKDLQANWIKFHEEHKNDPDAKYFQLCHSQGAIHVKNALQGAPQEIRDRVIVLAIAPAAVVPKGLCYDSFNYASKRDPIPYFEAAFKYDADAPYEERMSEPSREALKELILLEPHPDASFGDHVLDSPTFKQIIQDQIEDFIKEYGEPT